MVVTPEMTLRVVTRRSPGLAEAVGAHRMGIGRPTETVSNGVAVLSSVRVHAFDVSAPVTTDVSDLAVMLRARTVSPAVYLSLLFGFPRALPVRNRLDDNGGITPTGERPGTPPCGRARGLGGLVAHAPGSGVGSPCQGVVRFGTPALDLIWWWWSRRAESSRTGTPFIIPITVLMLWIKPPGRRDTWVAADIFAWSIVVASAVALALEVTDVFPPGIRSSAATSSTSPNTTVARTG